MKTQLKRVCDNRERYYTISLYTTLFGYFCIERVYGASKNKTPTGIKREYFNEVSEAKSQYSSIMKAKISKGYSVK